MKGPKGGGIKFLRGIPGEVGGKKETMSLVVEDSETGKLKDLKPDLVVLAVGISPSSNSDKIAETLGISRDASGFFTSLNEKTAIVETSRPGIYMQGPPLPERYT